ncbi:hypothetical protein ACI2VC_06880 [Ralstonia nicotianae]
MNINPTFTGEMQLAGWSETHNGGCRVTSKTENRHGQKGSHTYVSWQAMRQRCNDENRENFDYYGGRGIKVCDRWASFRLFLEDMGERPTGHTLDRINPEGDYEPGNCRWIPAEKQAANRRYNHRIAYQGEVLNLAELARRLNVPRGRLLKRLKLGWTHAEIIEGRRNV